MNEDVISVYYATSLDIRTFDVPMTIVVALLYLRASGAGWPSIQPLASRVLCLIRLSLRSILSQGSTV
jgi:hypothetical protein